MKTVNDDLISTLIENAIEEKMKMQDYNWSWQLFLGLNFKQLENKPNAILIFNKELYDNWLKELKTDYVKQYYTFVGLFEVRTDENIKDICLKFYWEENDLSGLNESAYGYVMSQLFANHDS